ncbi:MAG TPA: WYL domain-containing protein, partial [Gammaproteobacteria bacterium]|nr:WYL domain-containing protein [Gammaproteobacteria bacterium]
MLRARKAVTRREIEETFEISRATFKRDLEYLRDRLDYPIVYDPAVRAYRLETSGDDESAPSLKRVPLDARDPRAVLASAGAIAEVSTALAGNVSDRSLRGAADESITDRIRVISLLWPRIHTETYRAVLSAMLRNRRLGVRCPAACQDLESVANHELSPQRLTRYCNVWFLDAWCHTHSRCTSVRLRSIESAWPSTQRAVRVDLDELEDALDARYGLYTSQARHVAVLEFQPDSVAQIDGEMWDEAGMGER